MYAAGTAEEFLSEAYWRERGLIMETKLYPTKRKDMKFMTLEEWTHTVKDVRVGLEGRLKVLKCKQNEFFISMPQIARFPSKKPSRRPIAFTKKAFSNASVSPIANDGKLPKYARFVRRMAGLKQLVIWASITLSSDQSRRS